MKKTNLRNIVWPGELSSSSFGWKMGNYLNQLLKGYSPYCQNIGKFLKEAKIDPVGCWWEMYLANVMLENGHRLEKAPSKGPDIKVLLNDGNILWIEAISVNGGNGIRTDFTPNGSVPEEPYLLRLTSGIHDKRKKMRQYLKDGIVSAEDYLIIAINTGKFSFFGGDGPYYPAIAKVAFKIGPFALRWSIEEGKAKGSPEGFHQERAKIKKKEETEISTNLFSLPEYVDVSALIYSGQNYGVLPNASAITTVYNPFARKKLSENFFNFGKRCFVQENQVIYQKYEDGAWSAHKSGF